MVYGGYKYYEPDYVPDPDNDLITFFWVSGKYNIEKLAEGIAAESSVGTWTPIKTSNEKVFNNYRARIFRIVRTSETSGFIWIAYPMDHFEEDNLLQILASIRGNIYGLTELGALKFLDIYLPHRLQRHFKGPKYGIEGIRKRIGTETSRRPHSGTIVKPKVGLSAREWSDVAYNAYLGGLDFVKDDENLVDQSFCRWKDRVDLMMEVIDKIKDEQGRRVLYAPNITGRYSRLLERMDYLKSVGWDVVMLDVYMLGYSALIDIVEELHKNNFIIHAHRAGHTAETRGDFGAHYDIFAKLWRLIGVDQLHTGTGVGKMEGSPLTINKYARQVTKTHIEEATYLLALDFKWDDHIAPIMPVASGGVNAGMVDALGVIYGRDFVAQAGGGVHGHPGGTVGGARSLRAAVDALGDGVSALEKAKEVPELQQAIDTWGYVDPAEVKRIMDMVDENKDMFKNMLFTMGYKAFELLEQLK